MNNYGASALQVIMDASGCSPTGEESRAIGASAAASVATDFDELTRSSAYPDIGAFVFHAIQ